MRAPTDVRVTSISNSIHVCVLLIWIHHRRTVVARIPTTIPCTISVCICLELQITPIVYSLIDLIQKFSIDSSLLYSSVFSRTEYRFNLTSSIDDLLFSNLTHTSCINGRNELLYDKHALSRWSILQYSHW